ncbi:Protein M3 [Marasmius crinis-equi]|uniref:Protein M3 n=1 Tax=Marasmius crinis-equi TaxID=585013 RepID=A0ABR3F8Z5_9AGAR
MSPTAGFLIYSGIMPLLKTYFTVGFGYLVARQGLFPPAASRGASQITMNVSLPCLIFASMVPAFNNENVSAIGPLLLIAAIYLVLGFLGGVLIRELFYIPRNFWQGIVVLTTMSNWGNLPNAIVITVTQQDPFDPNKDPGLGVSYVSVFIFAFNLAFWFCGLANSLAWDYADGVPQGVDAEIHHTWDEKPVGAFLAKYVLRGNKRREPSDEKGKERTTFGSRSETNLTVVESMRGTSEVEAGGNADPDFRLARQMSQTSFRSRKLSGTQANRPTVIGSSLSAHTENPNSGAATPIRSGAVTPVLHAPSIMISEHGEEVKARRLKIPPAIMWLSKPLRTLFNPIVISMVISIPCALVPELKALFVADSGGPNWKAPDGRAPLNVIYDTCKFVGDITVPMGLILLGASFARMKIPRPLSRLPIPAMMAASVLKLAILPVIGVFLVQGLVNRGLIPADAKAEKFVAMFLSGTPAAVNQLIVSSLYSPDGELDILTAFLLVQYFFMFFSSAALTAVSLLLV